MKVLHLINSLSAGGAELQLLTLCRELKARGVDVVVGALRERVEGNRSLRPQFEAAGIRVVDLRAEGRYDWRFPLRATQLLRRERPDLLHTHLPRADLAGAIASRLAGTPRWVCSLHALYADCWGPKFLLPVMQATWRRADAVIAISEAVKDWLCRQGSVPRAKIRVIHYGIDARSFANDKRGANGNGRNRATAPVIGSIGRLEPGKGHDTLIRAMPRILARLPEARLHIVGHDVDGYGAALRSLAAGLGVEGRVSFLGFRSDIPAFFADIDLFAFASRSEGFGQVVVEAMAAERPVVASRIPSLQEIVLDRKTGLLVDPEDPVEFAEALLWLSNHSEEASSMVGRARERAVSCFTERVMADRTLSLYAEICRG